MPVLQHDLPDHCENSNPDHYGPEGGLMTEKGGALFGYTDLYGGYDGGQAEFVPYADFGPRRAPDNLSDEQVLFLTDIDWANVRGGKVAAIFGAEPVGIMAAILVAKLKERKGLRLPHGLDLS